MAYQYDADVRFVFEIEASTWQPPSFIATAKYPGADVFNVFSHVAWQGREAVECSLLKMATAVR